jgi:hypothetical protein
VVTKLINQEDSLKINFQTGFVPNGTIPKKGM